MSDNDITNNNISKDYSNFLEGKIQKEQDAKKIIEDNLLKLKMINNKIKKRKKRKKTTKTTKIKHRSGSVSSSLSNSSYVSSDSPSLYGGRKRSMRRKRNGGKTMKSRMKK